MSCLQCSHLALAFKSRLAAYLKAGADPFYRITTEFAARKQVDMERAKSELEDHQSACHLLSSVRLVHA